MDPAEPAEPGESPTDRDGLISLLQHLLSRRTGYPVDMLAPELDMEAELGVDSIKRVEVLGALRRRLPAELGLRLQELGEQLSRCRTLNILADTLLAGFTPGESGQGEAPRLVTEIDTAEDIPRPEEEPPAEAMPIEEEMSEPGEVQPIPRLVMRAMAEPIIDLGGGDDAVGLFLVTRDQRGVCDPLCSKLGDKGAVVRVLEPAELASPEDMDRKVAAWRAESGPVRGIVHLASLGGQPAEDLAEWKHQTLVQAKSLFHLLKLCRLDLTLKDQPRMSRVLAATALGGWFGRDGAAGDEPPAGGGCLGLLRTLDKEWAPVLAKVVDLPGGADAERLAEVLTKELMWLGGELEVGYPDFKRRVFATIESPLKTEKARLVPSGDWVVLATGGARGITALCLNTILRPGMRLVLVGSSPAPGPEPAELAGLENEADMRAALIAQSVQQGEGATPALVEARLSSMMHQREMRANLAEFARRGALVEYHALDVRDGQALAGLLSDVYQRCGRLDAVLHGAGVIEDRLITEKDASGFDLVFDTKQDPAFTLARSLRPDSLKLLAFFSSVSGRFGNRGQADYAAANEGLNRLAWWLSGRWPQARVVSINWGPWEGSGMAGQEVARLLARRGMGLIAPRAGAEFFRNEVIFGGRGRAEVIAGSGPWQADWPLAGLAHPDLNLFWGEQP
jgi:NAD(P)-dependent dehydrogenase (short-subunit alcohol dehydrogenase family)